MTKLSPKALRFIDAAVAESADARVKAAWNGFDRDPATEPPDMVARTALSVLQKVERRLRRELDSPSLPDDDAADISNDLGFVCAVEDDLRRQLAPGRI